MTFYDFPMIFLTSGARHGTLGTQRPIPSKNPKRPGSSATGHGQAIAKSWLWARSHDVGNHGKSQEIIGKSQDNQSEILFFLVFFTFVG